MGPLVSYVVHLKGRIASQFPLDRQRPLLHVRILRLLGNDDGDEAVCRGCYRINRRKVWEQLIGRLGDIAGGLLQVVAFGAGAFSFDAYRRGTEAR